MIGIEKKLIKDELTMYRFPYLEKSYGIIFCFTSRYGGCSKGKFNSLNLDYNTGDNNKNVKRNRELLLEKLNLKEIKKVYSARQVHGNRILDIGKNFDLSADDIKQKADCLITDLEDTPLMVLGADCNLILVADKEKKVIAAVHAGWKGTLNEIISRTILYMIRKYKSDAEDIFVAFGPSIRKCCYKVDGYTIEKFIKKFGDEDFYTAGNDGFFLDLIGINYIQLKSSGISEENIFDCKECTYCNNSYFSYRRSKITGRQAGVAVIL
jgi:polyphenol oxidase